MARHVEKFTYQYGDETITLPKFGQMPFGIRRKLRYIHDDEESMIVIIEGVADEESLAVIDKMYDEELADFLAAWQRDADITLGESEASGES